MVESIAHQLQLAADFIDQELQARGIFGVGRADCLKIARQLYDIWMRPGGPQRYLPPGEIAAKFRERYELPLTEIAVAAVEAPL